ncbi:MAG: ABC transporter ATP-binding protein [Desulfurococcales archaeon]|nr:ABC transporter ATP-binding protein [Desulfurococcales archaeon]
MGDTEAGGSPEAIVFEGVSKEYRMGKVAIRVLDEVSFRVERGTFTALVGPSGSGKSTIIFLAAGIDVPSRGTVRVLGEEISGRSESWRRRWRRRSVGIVFQFFHLIPTLTVLENVMLPMELAGVRGDRESRALDLLEFVGMRGKAGRYPAELSGGEQQRVAIARALAADPPLILADEPTANLDYENKVRVVELLRRASEEGKTVFFATHDEGLVRGADRVVRILDGRIVEA